jgi:hypothetical protein
MRKILTLLFFALSNILYSQCNIKEYEGDGEAIVREHKAERIENLAGPNNNGDLGEGYLNTFASTFASTKNQFGFMLYSFGSKIYKEAAEPRQVVFIFKNGKLLDFRSDRVQTRVDVNCYTYIVSKEDFFSLGLYELKSIKIIDYKAGTSRKVDITYDKVLIDQINCLFRE